VGCYNSPPTYDDDVNDEDPIEEPLATDLEEEYEEYGLHPIFGGLYPKKDDQFEDEEPTNDIVDYEENDIADYEEGDEEFSGEVPNFNGEKGDYVDFLGVKDILNSPNKDYGEFYADENNYMFTRGTMAHPILSIFMACERENEREKYGKVEYLPSDMQGFNYKHRGMLMMKGIAFIVVCCFVLILRNDECNELTRHPKDRGKNRPNLRMNSFQQRKNDTDYVAINLFYFLNRFYVIILLGLWFWESLFCYFIRFRFWAINICL
jgi:hypothetical protein